MLSFQDRGLGIRRFMVFNQTLLGKNGFSVLDWRQIFYGVGEFPLSMGFHRMVGAQLLWEGPMM